MSIQKNIAAMIRKSIKKEPTCYHPMVQELAEERMKMEKSLRVLSDRLYQLEKSTNHE